MKFLAKISAAASFLYLAFGIKLVMAQGLGQGLLDEVGKEAGISSTPGGGDQLPVIVGNIVRALIGVLGIVFLVLLIVGGFKWMTARGDKDTVGKARDTITHAIIGLIIVIASYAITSFVISRLVKPVFGA